MKQCTSCCDYFLVKKGTEEIIIPVKNLKEIYHFSRFLMLTEKSFIGLAGQIGTTNAFYLTVRD